MIYPSILERRYLEYLPFVEQVASRVKDTIINFCEKNGYASTYRIKTIPTKQIPLSISLWQYFIAILVEHQFIKFPLPKYYFHVTDELITLYPKCFDNNINSSFQYHS